VKSEAPANYYPVNAAIFIEDKAAGELMLVINDRPMGGTGFRKGCIELMFNRRGSTNDDLGMPEGISEFYNGLPVRTHHKYYLKFSTSREEIYNVMYRYAITRNQNPLQYFHSLDFTVLNDSKT
jgi:hypothetical protein